MMRPCAKRKKCSIRYAFRKRKPCCRAFRISFPVPSCYAHPIVLKRMIDAVEEGQAVTTAEALDAVKARLQAVNADVQVEQEEYDEIVAIKALFLNHDYQ